MTSRIIGSSDVTARGVNTRLTSARKRSCSGGSIMMMLPEARDLLGILREREEVDAVRAREALPVPVRGQDVGEARQRVEPVLLAEVHGRLVAQPPVHLRRVVEEARPRTGRTRRVAFRCSYGREPRLGRDVDVRQGPAARNLRTGGHGRGRSPRRMASSTSPMTQVTPGSRPSGRAPSRRRAARTTRRSTARRASRPRSRGRLPATRAARPTPRRAARRAGAGARRASVGSSRRARLERERRHVLEDPRGVRRSMSSSASPSSSTPASCSSRAITASRSSRSSAKCRYTVRSFTPARSATPRTVSARQFQIGEAVQELGARGDDALARLGGSLAADAGCRTAGGPASCSRRGVTASTTGSVSQPRTVEVGASLAFVAVDVPLREALQHLFERDAAFEPGRARRRGRSGCRSRR